MAFFGNLILLVSISLASGLCSTCQEKRCYANGECIVGCETGYVGNYCDERCPSRCLNNECYVDRDKGTVTCIDGCESGYCGAKCTQACDDGCVTCDRQCGSCNVTLCPERRYGVDCREICIPRYNKCDRFSGQCIRCRRGYFGDECTRECEECFHTDDDLSDKCLSGCDKCETEKACEAGFHGRSCGLKCSSGCLNTRGCNRKTGECSDGCVAGYHGLACNYTCSEHCLSGRCNRETGECSSGCVPGYHGQNCNYTCSEHCQSGRCNRATGECSSGCVSGYYGLACNYTCSKQCLDRKCDQDTGECSAGCVSGYHGLICTYTCSEHCRAGRCNRTTGECSSGCVSGYQGLKCKTPVEKESKDECCIVSKTIFPVVTVVLVLLLGGVLLFVFRRRLCLRCRNRDSESFEREPLMLTHLNERTQSQIDSMTSGMIQISAVDTVINMLQSGRNWVTIIGNAGDGKTTLGYLVLKQLREKNMRVYNIQEPEEYNFLRSTNKCVIMFDDRFGAFTSDNVLVDKWRDVMTDIDKKIGMNGNERKVVFVSRVNVMKEAEDYLGYFKNTILHPDNVVDLSSLKIKDERLNILDYYLKQDNLEVSSEVRQRVADLDIAHGFPHCSMMYPKLKKTRDLDIVEFFKTPLKFLDTTTKMLYHENCRELFELMIKNNGKFNANSLTDHTKRSSLLKVERDQEGSYITVWKDGVCSFAHPSIYESVLSVICDADPMFCVKHASLSVIRQKLTLTSDLTQTSPTQINVKPFPIVLQALAKRFQSEMLLRDYSVFNCSLCENRAFCEELLSCVYDAQEQDGSEQFINQPGKDGKTMLWTALKSGHMTAVQALVKSGADVNIKDGNGRTPLHYLFQLMEYTATSAADDQHPLTNDTLRVVIAEGGGDVNIQDDNGRTPLHYLFQLMEYTATSAADDQHPLTNDTLRVVIAEGGGDVNIQDDNGRTPLHYLFQHIASISTSAPGADQDRVANDALRVIINEGGGNVNIIDQCGNTPLHNLFKSQTLTLETIQWIITKCKGDVNKCEQNKSTPLHFLCAYTGLKQDTVDLVVREGKGDFNKEDEHGNTPLFYLCNIENVEFDVVRRIVNTAKGDINKQDHNGITPLHALCKGSVQIKDILTLIDQGDKADMYGNTPLHFICRRQGIDTDVLQQQLKQIPETEMNKQNSLGYTPLDYRTDQGDSRPWSDGMIERSAADLVVCTLKRGDKWIIVLGPARSLSSGKVHQSIQVEDFGRKLTNMTRRGQQKHTDQFSWFFGTCTSPVPLPPSTSPVYWETHSQLKWKECLEILLQFGVVEGPENDYKEECISKLPQSVCVSVTGYCRRHSGRLCIQVIRNGQEHTIDQVGQCISLKAPKPGEFINFTFGLVLDVGRGRAIFIDVEKRTILGKVAIDFKNEVIPMFHINANRDLCETEMEFVNSREISVDGKKKSLLQQALSD